MRNPERSIPLLAQNESLWAEGRNALFDQAWSHISGQE